MWNFVENVWKGVEFFHTPPQKNNGIHRPEYPDMEV